MKTVAVSLLGVFLVGLGGCANLESTAMSYANQRGESTGRVFLWNSNYMAGVGKDNELCVQPALTARANSADLSLSNPASGVELGGELRQAVTTVNPHSDRAKELMVRSCPQSRARFAK